ncbi:MAG: hypothetical protein ACRDTJ_15180, partial [Pseudonocardiaceae bacterium]
MSGIGRGGGRHHYREGAQPATPRLGHTHGHGHGQASPASYRVRMLLLVVLVPVALATLIGVGLTWPDDAPRSGVDIGFGQRPVHGEVLAATFAPCSSGNVGVSEEGAANKCVSLDVQLTDGDSPGVTIQQ